MLSLRVVFTSNLFFLAVLCTCGILAPLNQGLNPSPLCSGLNPSPLQWNVESYPRERRATKAALQTLGAETIEPTGLELVPAAREATAKRRLTPQQGSSPDSVQPEAHASPWRPSTARNKSVNK